MQTRAAFPLWPRLHADLLAFIDLVPEGGLSSRLPGCPLDLGGLFRHVAAVEDYWRRAVLEPDAPYREVAEAEAPDVPAIRARLAAVFEATERLLQGSLVEALAERPIRTSYPVKNALEALSLCHLHTVHHRAEIVATLRSIGTAPSDWISTGRLWMAPSPTRKERLDRAVALKKSRDLPEALRLLEELVSEDCADAYAASHLAHALLLRGRVKDALALADEVVARDPASGFTHFVRAEALYRLRRHADAASAYDEAIASGFASAYLHARLADARGRAGDAEGARAAAERGLAAHPGDGRLLLALGRVERAAGETDAATRHIEEAARQLPGDAYVYKEMIATRARARGPEAIEELKRLLRVPSQARNPHLHDELARLHAGAGDEASAIEEARRAHELAPHSQLYHRRLAFALVRARRDAEAVREIEACLDDEPEEPTLHRSYLAARRRLATLDEAESFYLALLKRHPEANKLHGWIRKLAAARTSSGEDPPSE